MTRWALLGRVTFTLQLDRVTPGGACLCLKLLSQFGQTPIHAQVDAGLAELGQ